MGVVVDFGENLESMLNELLEKYDGRIFSPQGKVIRILPFTRKWLNGKGKWIFRGGVYVSTLDEERILQCRLEAMREESDGENGTSWEKILAETEELTCRVQEEVESHGFIIKQGRYLFRGEQAFKSN